MKIIGNQLMGMQFAGRYKMDGGWVNLKNELPDRFLTSSIQA